MNIFATYNRHFMYIDAPVDGEFGQFGVVMEAIKIFALELREIADPVVSSD